MTTARAARETAASPSAGSARDMESWLRKQIIFHGADRNVLAWPFLMHFTSVVKDKPPAMGQAKENRLEPGQLATEEFLQTLTVGQRWADLWLLLQARRCGVLGSCCFHLLAWAGWGNQRGKFIQATVSSYSWACRGWLPSEQMKLPVGWSFVVLCPFAQEVTVYQ